MMTAEIEFEAPSAPGDYTVMVHVRSTGTVGADVRRKLSFTVQRLKRALPSSSSGGSTEATENGEGVDRLQLVDGEEPRLLEETSLEEAPPLL
jgi:hypothetical protein